MAPSIDPARARLIRAESDCRIGRHDWFWTGWPDPVGWHQCMWCHATREIPPPDQE